MFCLSTTVVFVQARWARLGAFKDVPRSVFGFVRDAEDGSRVMTQTKTTSAVTACPP